MHSKTFSHEDQRAFAQLSGDWNPIHVDPIAARRLLYGEQVVHGLHLVSWALNALCSESDGIMGMSKLTAVFRQPVLLGREVVLDATQSEAAEKRYTIEVDGQVMTELVVHMAETAAKLAFVNGTWPEEGPQDRDFDAMEAATGSLELRHDEALAAAQFPALAAQLDGGVISLLLASTRLVGMEVPGRHSLYSELELTFDGSEGSTGQMDYEVVQSHRDFRMLNTTITGDGWSGGIRSFMRPEPVEQLSMAAARNMVGTTDLSGQHALIVGGSRGLGEVTARLLAAAGAEVTVTYASGQTDAEALCAEIQSAGGRASAHRLDVLSPKLDALPDGITHVYYFAAPRIKPGSAQGMDADLFKTFLAFFVDGFAHLMAHVDGPVSVYYPSTVYVDTPEKGFTEYAASKAAGETLCRYLAKTRPNVEIEILKLPRMKTDQTQAIVGGGKSDDPADVLWPLLSAG